MMEMMHDPNTKIFLTQGHVPVDEFQLQVQSLGMVRGGDVVHGYVETIPRIGVKLLKKPVEYYTDREIKPVTYLRY